MNPKILHISISDSGGAGLAASRLNTAMIQEGLDSKLLCLHKTSSLEGVVKFSDSVFRKIYRASRFPGCNYIRNRNILSRRNGRYEAFSFPTTDYRIDRHPLVRESDIINLHFIGGFVDLSSFFQNIKKPVFWTLHDMNPFQGGFHYTEDMIYNRNWFHDLDDRILLEKKKAYSHAQNLRIITLNNWMYRQSASSDLLRKFAHYIIPNTLNTKIFHPQDKHEWRVFFNLPHDKFIFLFVSFDLKNPRKGGDMLYESISRLDSPEFHFCQIGKSHLSGNMENKIQAIGYISQEEIMAGLYSAVDAVIIPSREDNLPNVMMEALASGTPVIANPVGGITDVVRHMKNGILAGEVSAAGLEEAIRVFTANQSEFSREEIRNDFMAEYSEKTIAGKYLDAYHEAL